MNILEVKNLETSFVSKKEKLMAIRDISFEVKEKEILGIVGESGSGKSVTVKSIMGILPPNGQIENGEIIFEGKDLTQLGQDELSKILGKDVSMIFQDPMTALNPLRTIGYHLIEVIQRHQKVSKDEAKKIAIASLKQVEIPNAEERLNQYPHEFSGGMRQRVMIAMAISCYPKLLIADEPTTALDVTIQSQILNLIRNLQQDTDMSVVLITHDLGVVYTVCYRVIVMYGGKIMEEGTRDEIFNLPSHPYTLALLRSMPKVGSKEKLRPIEGVAPSLNEMPEGCPFALRCEFAKDECKKNMPEANVYSETHKSFCFFSKEELDG